MASATPDLPPELPSHRASPSIGRYQFILLGEQRHTCVNLPRAVHKAGWPGLTPASYWLQVWCPNHYDTTPSHVPDVLNQNFKKINSVLSIGQQLILSLSYPVVGYITYYHVFFIQRVSPSFGQYQIILLVDKSLHDSELAAVIIQPLDHKPTH